MVHSKRLLGVLLVCGLFSCSPLPPRTNELAVEYPSGFGSLPTASRKLAVNYTTSWMKAFSNLGLSGIQDPDGLERARIELITPMLPLKTGLPEEQEAFKAAETVFEALKYLGTNMKSGGPWMDARMNRLLRITPNIKMTLRDYAIGVEALLYDYLDLADHMLFNAARAPGRIGA